MSSSSELVEGFQSSLSELTFNSKPIISMLTMLAEDYKDIAPLEIVRCIEKRLKEIGSGKELPLLYLIDSICKNVGGIYIDLFTQNIVSNFSQVFDKGNEKTRASLYKLRHTWTNVFSIDKLHAIDTKCHKIDPAWPVIARPASKLTDKPTPSTSSPTSTTNTTTSSIKSASGNTRAVNDPRSLRSVVRAKDGDFTNKLLLEKETVEPTKVQDRFQKLMKQIKVREIDGLSVEKKDDLENLTTTKVPPILNPARSRRAELEVKRKSLSPSLQSKRFKPSSKRGRKSPSPHNEVIKRSPNGGFVPAALHSPTISNSAPIPSASSPANPSPPPHLLALPIGEQFLCSQDRDYRKGFEAIKFVADERLKAGHLSRQQHSDLVEEVNKAMRYGSYFIDHLNGSRRLGLGGLPLSPQMQIPPSIYSGMDSQSLTSTHSEPNPHNDVEQLCTIVDGKSRNLYYLDDKTAIVLMKAPLNAPMSELIKANPNDLEPKQIRFEGKPTKVFIDSDRGSNEFILLEFNDQTKTFFHNEYEQRIKFGGPCKEIILNGKPYLATFGGPPIEVWFNGDTQAPHTLRLDGPPPRVKLSKEIRTDLWDEYTKKYTSLHSSNGPSQIEIFSSELTPTTTTFSSLAPALSSLSTGEISSASSLPLSSTLSPFNVIPNDNNDSNSILLPNVAVSSSQSSNINTTSDSSFSLNITDLYNKLVSAGIIAKDGKFASKLPPPSSPETVVTSSSSMVSASITTLVSNSSSISTSTTATTTAVPSEITSAPPVVAGPFKRDLGSLIGVIKTVGPTPLEEPIVFEQESLKLFHPSIVAELYNGIQCTNCSRRFDSETSQRSAYSKHLDWHFRRNRSEKSITSKTGLVRHDWLYPMDIWTKYREIQDPNDEYPSILDNIEESNDGAEEEEEEMATVPASEDEEMNKCPVCGEEFELAWFEDEEEWRLKKAIIGSKDGRIYHPLCYDDYIKQQLGSARSRENESEVSMSDDINNNQDNSDNSDSKSLPELLGLKDSPVVQSGLEDSSICCIM